MTAIAQLSPTALRLDATATIDTICRSLREMLRAPLRRRGLVVGLSGGVDSSVVAALAARAIGPERVLALLMPETDSATESQTLALELARQLGIRTMVEDISAILSAAGCYRRRDEAIRSVVPEYGEGYRCKIVLPDLIATAGYSVYHVVVRSPDGVERRVRLPLDAYLGVLAATNMKQRVRKMLEYSYADRYHYAVAGTPNRLEYDQGFFVKQGDGAADVKPIAHLYKTQVYQLAEELGIPEAIRRRRPTTDTYSLEQSQEEFYFGLTLEQTDLCVYARNNGVPAEAVADAVGLTPEQVQRAFRMIEGKREAARYLHLPALLIEDPR
jgi:NAD+ synthase